MYKIGILSDTHGLLRPEIKDILHSCDALLHCGDFNTLEIYRQLKTYAPFYAVRGNTDREWADALPRTLSVELFHLRFFMIHDKQLIREDISGCDIILSGHSHKYEHREAEGRTWLNPGSCGPKRFSLPVSMALIHTEGDGAFQIEPVFLSSRRSPAPGPGRTDAPMPFYADPADIPDMKRIIRRVMKETDKGKPVPAIAETCRIEEALAERICRLYLTHPGVSAEGILTKMGL